MEELHSEAIRQMIASASNHLQNNRKHINDCNVFPVPDGDTGTNMGMTFGAAADEALYFVKQNGKGYYKIHQI